MPADHQCLLSRRRLFLLAGAGIAARLPLGAASTPDFWNKKAPADWTDEEIDRLIAKSPWAKPVKAQYAPGEAPYDTNPGGNGTGTGGGYPGGGTAAEDILVAEPAADTPAADGADTPGHGRPRHRHSRPRRTQHPGNGPRTRKAAERRRPMRARCDGRAPAPSSKP